MGSSTSALSSSSEEELRWDIYDLSLSVHKSRRYHDLLAGFYASWRDWMKVVTAVAGSGLFLLVASDRPGAEATSAFVALWAVIDIIISPDKKHDLHRELCKRFTALAGEISSMAESVEEYKRLSKARLAIEEMEPSCKRLIDLMARNDECRARAYPPEDLVPLSWLQRRLGYYATFDMQRLENWKAERERQARARPATNEGLSVGA